MDSFQYDILIDNSIYSQNYSIDQSSDDVFDLLIDFLAINLVALMRLLEVQLKLCYNALSIR
jgi:hypothetical protein